MSPGAKGVQECELLLDWAGSTAITRVVLPRMSSSCGATAKKIELAVSNFNVWHLGAKTAVVLVKGSADGGDADPSDDESSDDDASDGED